MRHRKKGARLGRPADQRKALIRGLVTDVLKYGSITTTKVRPSPASSPVYTLLAHCVWPLSHVLRHISASWLLSPEALPLLCCRAPPQPRAKAIRKHIDHMVTLSKTGTLHARRQVRIKAAYMVSVQRWDYGHHFFADVDWDFL